MNLEFCLDTLHKQIATAVSSRAALTFWYKTIRPDESISEWQYDKETGTW
jgi:hypothetical protein